MKKGFLTYFFTIISCAFMNAQENIPEIVSHNSINWEEDFSKAISISKSEGKLVLIFFTGSDWCSPCKMLVADIFESEKFKEFSEEKFVLYEADFPRNKSLVTSSQKVNNLSLKNKYGVNSYPTIIIIDSKGKELGKMKGYNLMRDTSYHYSFFKSTLKK